ncbi:Proton-coupled folate transporter [Papilio machaon]|uniref:Proton-coupled folate transporter n=1 Tax=Papilio machaon TaxID=76193 RepID=A0A194RF29_PAPMA|nr:Proton-coupled folate transporter [Papilio machaon]
MADKKQREDKVKEKKEEKPLNDDVDKKIKKKTFIERLRHIKNNITVEPLLAGLIIPSVISRFAMSNFNLDKACRVNLDFGDEICTALVKRTSNNYSVWEKEVQKLISSIDIWKSVIHTSLPCILIMFLGAWSDRTGKRKICILLPIFGEFVTSINNLINVYFFYEIPVQVTVFLETLFPSITGGWVTMFLGVFSYISDITSEESRTFRVGLVNFCLTAGLPVGIGLSGILLQRLGYYGIFSVTAVLFFLVLTYGCFFLKEPNDWLRDNGRPVIERAETPNVSFFNMSHVVDTVDVATRRRPSNRRVKVILTLFSVFILYGPSMFPVVEIVNATTFTSLRSIISKLVEKQETAKVNSLFSLTETLGSLVFHPFYSWVYMRTLHALPGAVFLISAAFIVPAAFILTYFYSQHRKELRNARKTALENEEKKDVQKPQISNNLPETIGRIETEFEKSKL